MTNPELDLEKPPRTVFGAWNNSSSWVPARNLAVKHRSEKTSNSPASTVYRAVGEARRMRIVVSEAAKIAFTDAVEERRLTCDPSGRFAIHTSTRTAGAGAAGSHVCPSCPREEVGERARAASKPPSPSPCRLETGWLIHDGRCLKDS